MVFTGSGPPLATGLGLLDIRESIGTGYAYLVCEASTVKAAAPVLIIVSVYKSIELALPPVGAVPVIHFGVTAPPSI